MGYYEERLVARQLATDGGHVKKRVRPLQAAAFPSSGTTVQVIEAMPIQISHTATIRPVDQLTRNNRPVFSHISSSTSQLGRPTIEPAIAAQFGYSGQVEEIITDTLDIAEMVKQFLEVNTACKALDFLRRTGQFLPGGEDISWPDFQRWQKVARLAREPSILAAVFRATIIDSRRAARPDSLPRTAGTADDLDPTGEIREILKMLAGGEHSFFDPAPEPSEEDMELARRAAADGTDSSAWADERVRNLVEHMKRGAKIQQANRKFSEMVLGHLPPSLYRIEFQHRGESRFPLPLYLCPEGEIRPALRIDTDCTLTAIAATIFAERAANAEIGQCKGCEHQFARSVPTQIFCTQTCRDRIRKRTQRKNKRDATQQGARTAPNTRKRKAQTQRRNAPALRRPKD